MFIQAFPSGPFSTNAYLIACPLTKEAIIVDPAPGSARSVYLSIQQNNFACKAIVLTHSHWDHMADVQRLKAHDSIPVYIHPLDASNLETPGSDGLPCPMLIEGVKPDAFLEEGTSISVGTLTFQVIHTPGHSPGSICLYESSTATLIAGDTLFKGTIGNLSFPTSDPSLMWPSLSKLAKLPPETKVYPGHGPTTTIGAESWLPHAQQRFES